jgi:hypothetical protein
MARKTTDIFTHVEVRDSINNALGYTGSNKHVDAGRNNMQNRAYNGRMLQGSGKVSVN